MDVDRYASYRVHQQNDEQQWVGFNRATGARMSAMEHLVPEEMYSTEDAPANGISAVKAIQLAAAEGQHIWTITRDNLEQAMAASQLSSEIKTDIRNSVRAGREVTAHERPVSFFGKQSTGYIVLDPATGAGAYLIGSGENGGEIQSPDGIDVISWLLSLFEFVGETPVLKGIASRLGLIMDAIGVVQDYLECGAAYALAKLYATQLFVMGAAFMMLPYLAIFMSLYLALVVAFLTALAMAIIFSSVWTCRRE